VVIKNRHCDNECRGNGGRSAGRIMVFVSDAASLAFSPCPACFYLQTEEEFFDFFMSDIEQVHNAISSRPEDGYFIRPMAANLVRRRH